MAGKSHSKSSTRHWWQQRATALALVPLIVWFVTSLVMMAGADFEVVVAWLRHPLVTVFLLLMIGAGFYHLKLGIYEIIEDYVHQPSTKRIVLFLNSAFAAVFGLLAAVSILRIAFGG